MLEDGLQKVGLGLGQKKKREVHLAFMFDYRSGDDSFSADLNIVNSFTV